MAFICSIFLLSIAILKILSLSHFTGSNYYGDYYTNAEKVELLGDINNALENNRNWVVNVYLPDFKVPLIRAKYLPENMHCKHMLSLN